MTFPPIPVSEHEDAAFDELGVGSNHWGARNGADAPAANTKTRRVAAPSRPQPFPPRTDAHAADRNVAATQSPARASSFARAGKPSTTSPAGVQARRGSRARKGSSPVSFSNLSMSPVAFTVGVWALYALMTLTAWRAVR